MLSKRKTFLSNFEDTLWSCKAGGFSLVELLFALVILSFGLTALIHTHSISASTLKNAQERYNALLIAQQVMDHALVSKEIINLSNKICRNNVWYFVSQHMNYISGDQKIVTIEVKWRQSLLKLSANYCH